ncbi:MAG: VCBS repeat-containing protein [Acidobacteriota bacterium]|nr:VCBS repeat-containing protein [Acidobacteriota bacterium]
MRKTLNTIALFCAILFATSLAVSAQTLLNEIAINPPGTDNPCEYIEIRGTPGATLTNTYVAAVEGDAAPSGTFDLVVDLGNRTIGSNGILIITGATTCPGRTIAAGATQVTDQQLDTGTSGIENGTITFLLISSTTPIVEGTDYDTNNDGTLEALPAGATILDAIGVTDEDAGDIVYFGQVVIQSGTNPPQAITRFSNNTTPRSSAAWFGGGLDTAAGSSSTVYSATNRTANFPTGGALTPGAQNVGTFAPKDAPVDFNGDGRTDYVVTGFARGTSTQTEKVWYVQPNGGAANTSYQRQFGFFTDINVPEDYDGDGRDDIAVWRVVPTDQNRAYFYILRSSDNTLQIQQFGTVGDNPTVVGDYDGDNRADVAVFRSPGSAAPMPCGPNSAVWFYRTATTPASSWSYTCWGANNDLPAPGDYDGDNRNDFAVFRPGQGLFLVSKSGGGTDVVPFGAAGDLTIPGDYDGDGRTDYAVARAGTPRLFFIRTQTGATQTYQFGANSDILAPGDYDGDGKTDIAVWRPSDGTFYVRPAQTSGAADFAFRWGVQGDLPAVSYLVH